MSCGQPWSACYRAAAGPASAFLLLCCFVSYKVVTASSRSDPMAFSELDVDIFKCFLQGDLYCNAHSDLWLPPDLHSCVLFPGSRGTRRHAGGPAWAGWGRVGRGAAGLTLCPIYFHLPMPRPSAPLDPRQAISAFPKPGAPRNLDL